jgi:hypothetical protein
MPPFWVHELVRQTWAQEDAAGPGEWSEVKGKGKKQRVDDEMTRTHYGFWKSGFDIKFIQPPQIPQAIVTEEKGGKKKKKQATVTFVRPETIQNIMSEYRGRLAGFFVPLGFTNEVPVIPSGNRPMVELLSSDRVWSMSLDERLRIATFWEDEMRSIAYNSHVGEYQTLRKEYEEACTRFNDVKDEVYLFR